VCVAVSAQETDRYSRALQDCKANGMAHTVMIARVLLPMARREVRVGVININIIIIIIIIIITIIIIIIMYRRYGWVGVDTPPSATSLAGAGALGHR
jgi:hypothetical protein